MRATYSFIHHLKYNYYTSLFRNQNFQQKVYIPVRYVKTFKMPRSSTHVLNMQRVRQKIKEKSIKHFNNTDVSLQILGSGARGTPRCVYLMTGHNKYIFNCGEGSLRLAYEHKCKLIKLEHVFVTSASWNNLGGIPGMLLTLQDIGVPNINIHGPKGTIEIFNAVKRFIQLSNLKIHEAKCNESEQFVDQVMSVTYVPIINTNVQKIESNIGEEIIDDVNNYYNYTLNSNGKRVPDKIEKKESSKVRKIEQTSNKGIISSIMSYICKLHSRAGTLNLEKCVEKGVKPGRELGQLKAGNDITLPDGTIVLSKDVMSPSVPGPVFLVVECPSKDYLESFVNQPAFAKLQTGGISNAEDIPYCIVHFTPQNVMDDSRYVDWMGKFGLNTRHIVVNEENECMGTEAVHRHQHKLHLLHPDIFPFLNEESFKKKTRPGDLPIIHRSRTHHTIHLQPKLNFSTEKEIMLQPKEYLDEVFEIHGFLDALAELQTNISNQEKSLLIKNEYPKIVMLGTGCSIPSKVRNTSGILLRIDENHSILLDCGEGTFGQIMRIYGNSETNNIMRTIKAIYVSHLHADHHIGLIGLLKEREKFTQEPLYLFAPLHIASWLQMYHKRFEPILHQLILISNNELLMDIHQPEDKYVNMYATLNVQVIMTVHVKHCPYAYGISVTLHDGKKIVYSGDTIPCETLVELGQGCDLLIHEATMEDDLLEEAKIKYHSTVSQAIQMGKQMKAKFTLLTHFSQRYSVIPQLPQDENRPRFNDVGIAYDNMHISLSQLSFLPSMYPVLKLMFNKHYTELEERAAKRRMVTD